jgi:hypothetical protein
MRWVSLLVLVLVLALAGCGGGHKQACPQVTRALARLNADVAAIRKASNGREATLKGAPAVNRATDRFLRDVELAPIDLLSKNRMIDHAMSALLGTCQQCFQALEAERPIAATPHRYNTECRATH